MLAGGLRRWTSFHPEWKQEVGSVLYASADAVVVIDPLVPSDGADRLWQELDAAVEDGKPVHVLVSVFWHTRNTREVAERYGARVWAASRGRRAIERRAGTVTDVFRAGDTLPGDVRALATARANEVVFWIPEHRALVPGDVILGGDAGLRLCPESWLPEGVGHADLRASLAPVTELPVEQVLVSHGPPLLEDGREALARLLAA